MGAQDALHERINELTELLNSGQAPPAPAQTNELPPDPLIVAYDTKRQEFEVTREELRASYDHKTDDGNLSYHDPMHGMFFFRTLDEDRINDEIYRTATIHTIAGPLGRCPITFDDVRADNSSLSEILHVDPLLTTVQVSDRTSILRKTARSKWLYALIQFLLLFLFLFITFIYFLINFLPYHLQTEVDISCNCPIIIDWARSTATAIHYATTRDCADLMRSSNKFQDFNFHTYCVFGTPFSFSWWSIFFLLDVFIFFAWSFHFFIWPRVRIVVGICSDPDCRFFDDHCHYKCGDPDSSDPFTCKYHSSTHRTQYIISLEMLTQLLGGMKVDPSKTAADMRSILTQTANRMHTINLNKFDNLRYSVVPNTVEFALVAFDHKVRNLRLRFEDSGYPQSFSGEAPAFN